MHYRKLSNPTIKRVLKLLMTGKEFTTRDIDRKARVCAVSAVVAEIRANGVGVDCTQRKGRFYYRLGKYKAA